MHSGKTQVLMRNTNQLTDQLSSSVTDHVQHLSVSNGLVCMDGSSVTSLVSPIRLAHRYGVCVCVFAFVDACLVISISAIDCCERNDLLCVKCDVKACSLTRVLLEVNYTEQLYLLNWSFVF